MNTAKEILKLVSKLETLRSQNIELRATLEHERKVYEVERDAHHERFAQMQGKLDDARRDLMMANRKIDEKDETLDAVTELRDQLQKDVADLKDTMMDVGSDYAAFRSSVRDMLMRFDHDVEYNTPDLLYDLRKLAEK